MTQRHLCDDDPHGMLSRTLDMERVTHTRDRALLLALAPVLIAQAAWVMARAPRLPEADGPRHGVIGQGPTLRLLIVGDSSAAGVGVPSQEGALSGQLCALLADRFTVDWRVVARSGATTGEKLDALRAAGIGPVDVAVTAIGVNDVKNGVVLGRYLDDTEALHAYLADDLHAKQIIVSGFPPLELFPALPRPLSTVLGRRARTFEAALQTRLTHKTRPVTYLRFDHDLQDTDMAEDGFHPGASLYRIWARKIAARITAPAARRPDA